MATQNGSAAPAVSRGDRADRAGLHAVDGPGAWAGPTGARPRSRSARLSGKEVSVLHELARGSSTEEIADLLFVSPHTVRTHVKNGMRKLEARTRAHAVAIALSEGAIQGEPR